MDEALIDDANLSLSRQSLLPGAGFFTPDSVGKEATDRAAERALSGAHTAVVADPDADGLGCVALVREAFDAPTLDVAPNPDATSEREAEGRGDTDTEDGPSERERPPSGSVESGAGAATDATGGVAMLPAGPHELDGAIADLAAHFDGARAFVCDLCPDDRDDLTGLADVADRADVRWYDHHQWEPSDAVRVREPGVTLTVGESDEECSTDVALRRLRATGHEFPARFEELAAVTRDHDLWLREDPRSDDLADYAHWTDPETFVAVVRAHGADLPPAAEAFLADRRVRKEALIERAVDRAEFRTIDGVTVGVTYGRCSQNEVAETLREQGADAAVIVKPAGSASIRGTESFQRCHEVARQVNGGGHPKAAGCKPGIYDDVLDYAHHWTTRGAVAKQVILGAFRSLPPEDGGGEGVEGDR